MPCSLPPLSSYSGPTVAIAGRSHVDRLLEQLCEHRGPARRLNMQLAIQICARGHYCANKTPLRVIEARPAPSMPNHICASSGKTSHQFMRLWLVCWATYLDHGKSNGISCMECF